MGTFNSNTSIALPGTVGGVVKVTVISELLLAGATVTAWLATCVLTPPGKAPALVCNRTLTVWLTLAASTANVTVLIRTGAGAASW